MCRLLGVCGDSRTPGLEVNGVFEVRFYTWFTRGTVTHFLPLESTCVKNGQHELIWLKMILRVEVVFNNYLCLLLVVWLGCLF